MNNCIVQQNKDGKWVDVQEFPDYLEAQLFVSAQKNPAEWRIVDAPAG
jgi:hypothetical protein